MNITEVRIKLLENQPDKLRGFASITIDDFIVIRDLKIIEGGHGLFIAMPSRKLCDRCASCGGKNHLRARFCNDCGKRLRADRGMQDERGRMRLYADISHPIHQKARDFVERRVLESFQHELERSKQDGYVAHSFDDLDYESYEIRPAQPRSNQQHQQHHHHNHVD
jgi:stage V sporulation protein G